MINLLPPLQLNKIKLLKLSKKVSWLFIFLFTVNISIIGYLVFSFFILRIDLESATERATPVNEERVNDLSRIEEEVKGTYALIQKAKKLDKAEEKKFTWSQVLEELAGSIPPGITLETFKPNEELTEITITGTAVSRDQILVLEEKLKNSDLYTEVVAPVSNLVAKNDVTFEFTLKLTNGEENKK